MKRLSKTRVQVIFWLGLFFLPFMTLISVEGLLTVLYPRLPSDPLLNLTYPASLFSEVVEKGKRYYRVSHAQAYRERNTQFLREKPADVFRVFALGGSASAGWPHKKEDSYPALLEAYLQEVMPDQKVEVINVGAHAFASYRVKLIFDEVIHFDPDAFVIYSGNNEFLEKRNYINNSKKVAKVVSVANQFKLFRILRMQMAKLRNPGQMISGSQRHGIAQEITSKVKRQSLALRQDPVQFAGVKDHYKITIEAMLKRAGKANVPVYLLTVPTNQRDWQPNVSYHGLEGEKKAEFERVYKSARRAYQDGDLAQSLQLFAEAISRGPLHADAHFLLGRVKEALGDNEGAQQAYFQAKELDHNPFRALEEQNQAIRGFGEKYAHVTVIDMAQVFQDVTKLPAPGFDLFLDYVHPRIEGNDLIARTVASTMAKQTISPRSEVFEERTYYEGTLLWLYAMMHQYSALIDRAEKVRASSTSYPVKVKNLAKDVLAVFPAFQTLDRFRLKGTHHSEKWAANVEAQYDNFYQKYFKKYLIQ